MVDLGKIKDGVVPKVKWYLKYRTQILVIGSLVIGFFGGNVDRITKWIPTLKYDTPTIEQKLNQVEEIEENLKKIREQLDELKKSEYNNVDTVDYKRVSIPSVF
jgi:hypothetical protein